MLEGTFSLVAAPMVYEKKISKIRNISDLFILNTIYMNDKILIYSQLAFYLDQCRTNIDRTGILSCL